MTSSATSKTYRIALIAGDGIGKEVMPEGLRVVQAAAARFGIALETTAINWASCDYYAAHGKMMPDDWKAQLAGMDAIFFGAVGWPATVPDHVSLWGSLLKFRREFDQYINLRPVRLFEGVPCPLAGRQPGDIDYYVVRENTEGEYTSLGGLMYEGTDREICIQESVYSRHGANRLLKFAFDLAQSRAKKHVTLATKSNGIAISMPWWDQRADDVAKGYPEVTLDKQHIDILPGPRHHRHDWPRALGQPQPRAQLPQPVRACARLGARHLRQEHREPDCHDLVGRADAGLPHPGSGRRTGGARRHRQRHRRGDQERPAHTGPGRHGQHHAGG